MFRTFWHMPRDSYLCVMSENARFYPEKMAELRAIRRLRRPLQHQLKEILSVVAECERRWAVEDRIDRQIGRS